MPPSAIFYNDSLEPCANNGVINWSGLPDPRLPLIFIGSEAKEDDVDEVRLVLFLDLSLRSQSSV